MHTGISFHCLDWAEGSGLEDWGDCDKQHPGNNTRVLFRSTFLYAISISIVGSVGHSQVLFLKYMNIKANEVGPLCPLGSLGSLGS